MTAQTEGNARWQILGAGAQGLLWAARLAQAGIPVTLRLKSGRSPLTTIHYQLGEQSQAVSIASAPLDQSLPSADLLVTVKATDVETALRAFLGTNPPPLLVVLLQNGIGAEAIARRCLPSETVIWLGTSTHGSFRTAQDTVVHAGIGGIWLGPGRGVLSAHAHTLALAALQRSGLNVSWDEDIQARLWHKLAINSCINPLTALLDCRNGDLLQLPLAQQWLPALAEEAAAALTALGHGLSSRDLLTKVQEIAVQTASNYNSMQQDYALQRPTEIEFITGSLLQAAAVHGLQLPHHAELLARVQQRQAFGV